MDEQKRRDSPLFGFPNKERHVDPRSSFDRIMTGEVVHVDDPLWDRYWSRVCAGRRALLANDTLKWSPSWTLGSGVVREPVAKPAVAESESGCRFEEPNRRETLTFNKDTYSAALGSLD